uniref:Uncharacterized protein n=1 Tax=Bionectria ochroleuca TaxID=29856 RepID=A0A8H7NQS2_BIOOC
MEVETSNFSMLYHVSILVGDIFEHIAQVIAGENASKLYQDLEKEISLTVCNMIEEAGSTSTKFCESIALALSSLLLLQLFRATRQLKSHSAREDDIALQTTKRMVLDMNKTANYILQTNGASTMSLVGICSVCSAGVLLVLASQRGQQTSLTDSDLAIIRFNLKALNRRWGIGAMYLRCLGEDLGLDGLVLNSENDNSIAQIIKI